MAIDSFTKTLLNFPGSNGSTTITDSALSPKSWTVGGSATIDTSTSPYVTGGNCISLPTAGDIVGVNDDADWAMGTGDFTWDFWIKSATTGAIQNIFGQGNSGLTGGYHYCRIRADNKLFWSMNDDTILLASTTSIADTNWHHGEIQREGNTMKLALDGVWEATVDVTAVTYTDSPGRLTLGQIGDYAIGQLPVRRITGFRCSKGIARHPGFPTFPPPNRPYANSRPVFRKPQHSFRRPF